MARPAQPRDLRLLSKVSRLYYEQGLTQQMIADRLRLSRARISRLLKQARSDGMVRITVLASPGSYPDLEGRLEDRFGLREVVVVDVTDPTSQEMVSREIGIAAAYYLHQTLADGDVLGITWGTTLRAMVAALLPRETRQVHIVQISGGLGEPTAEEHATALCRRMAVTLGARLTLLPTPGVMRSRQAKEALLSDSHVQAGLSLVPQITVAYVGIGVPTPSSVVMRDGDIISPEELAILSAKGAVGDIALRFFDAWGQPIRSELDERVIGISLGQLSRIPRVIGVAGGPEKMTAIRGAILGKLIDVLITDQVTASGLLQ